MIGKQNWNGHSKGEVDYKWFYKEDAIRMYFKKLGKKMQKQWKSCPNTHKVETPIHDNDLILTPTIAPQWLTMNLKLPRT